MTIADSKPYNDYSSWMAQRFDFKVQKISVDAGFTCPNRDGSISHGGCTFCDNRSFNPSYCKGGKSVKRQMEEGKMFFARKYPEMKYIAYFQAFSNTYADVDRLRSLYEEALEVEDVVGIIIGTRPDCIDDAKLDYISRLSEKTFVMVEYGIESTHDSTLRSINRGHTFAQSRHAVERTHEAGILCGAHVILGLPGESDEQIIDSASHISALPLDILKIHQLQILKGTRMAADAASIRTYTIEEYIALLASYIEHLRPSLVLERFVSQSPADMLIAPKWGLKNHEFTHKLIRYMKENGIVQGSRYSCSV